LKGYWAVLVIASILILGGIGISQQADAVVITITSSDLSQCDVLSTGTDADELGIAPAFSSLPFELITSALIDSTTGSCIGPDTGAGADLIVAITHTAGARAFFDVFYVADPDTTISNFDGFINDAFAFRIDSVGANTPLIFESKTTDGVWEPGETWHFVVQDYVNGVLPPEALGSIGVPSGPGSDFSSGSIVVGFIERVPIGGELLPIDTTALLLVGIQTNLAWIIPVALSAVGIGIFVVKKKF